jgi:hypothetical protein
MSPRLSTRIAAAAATRLEIPAMIPSRPRLASVSPWRGGPAQERVSALVLTAAEAGR